MLLQIKTIQTIILFYILLSPISVFSQQDTNIVDWKKLDPSASNEALKSYLYDLIDKSYEWNTNDRIAYLKKGYSASSALNNENYQYSFSERLGELYSLTDSNYLALKYLNLALSHTHNAKTEQNIYNIFGYFYLDNNDYNTAISYFQKAIETAKTIGDGSEVYAYSNICEAYKLFGDLKTSLKYGKLSIGAAKKLKSPEKEYSLVYAYSNTAERLHQLGVRDSLDRYLQLIVSNIEEIDTLKKFTYRNACLVGYSTLATIHIEQNQTHLALEYIQLAEKFTSNFYKIIIYDLYAKYFHKTQNYQAALKEIEKIDLSNEDDGTKIETLSLKKEIYNGLGNTSQVVKIQGQIIEIQKSKLDSDIVRLRAFGDVKYETLKKTEEVNTLKLDKQIQELNLRNYRFFSIIISIFGLSILVIAFLGYKYYQRQNQLLAKDLKNKKIIEIQAEKLQTLYDYKNKLFANIAHELRTPLTLIANPIKSVLQSKTLETKDSKQLKIADRNIRSLAGTIYQILDLAKRENVELTIQPISFDISELVQFIANDFESMAQFKSIHFIKPTTNLAIPVITDGEKLMIVIRNLLSNAFKFTANNGEVNIHITDLVNEVAINVEDTGKGIAPIDLEQIFDRHFQVNPVNLPNEGGMGIGLAICKEYMGLMKGSINAKSDIGKGSRFTICFPKELIEKTAINKDAAMAFNALITQNHLRENISSSIEEKVTSSIPNSLENVSSILIVEDNIDMSNYLNNILNEEHELYFAQDGLQALAFLENNQPDLIISDYMMPNMNGLELLNKLRNHQKHASIPVIMLTAQDALDVKLNALRIGIDDYLTKPFDNRELVARVNNILTNQRIIKAERLIETNVELEHNPTPAMNLEDLAWLAELETIALKYIYKMDFTVHQLAEEMAVSYSHIFPKIKQLTGLTPNQYITELRLQEARKLLEAKRYGSVKAVAYSIGYKSVKYFSKKYKKRFGKNPSEYLV